MGGRGAHRFAMDALFAVTELTFLLELSRPIRRDQWLIIMDKTWWWMQGARSGFRTSGNSSLPIERQIHLAALATCWRCVESIPNGSMKAFSAGYKGAVQRSAEKRMR